MAIITNCPLGEINGSIGPNTFFMSGNKQIVRKKVTPKNPNNTCQASARYSLKQIASRFNSLDYTSRQEFNVFALTNYFCAKSGGIPPYTGYQSFVGTKNLALQNFNNKLSSEGYTDPVIGWESLVPFHDFVDWTLPLFPASNELYLFTGGIGYLGLGDLRLYATPRLEMDTQLGVGELYSDTSVLMSNEGAYCGFSFYLSNPLKAQGEKPKQFYRKHLGYTGIVSLPGTSLNKFHGLNLRVDLSSAVNKCRFGFRAGQWFLVSVFIYSNSGFGNFFTSIYCQVQI